MRASFGTRDFEEARAVLAGAYGDHVPILHGEPDRFAFTTTVVQAGGLGLDSLHYGGLIENRFVLREDTLLVGLMRAGSLSYDDGSYQHVLATDELYWVRPDRPQQQLTEDVRFDFARLDLSALTRVAAEMSDLEPHQVRFHSRARGRARAERVRYWDATRRWIAEHVLADDALADEPLVRGEAFRSLALATVLAVPNTALDRLVDPVAPVPAAPEPATVRRAVAYIEEHAAEDIGLADVAAAARVTPRGLQAAFRRHRDQTPLEYLRRVRLDAAHRELEGADPTRGDTVAAIAARWGFAHPGRFSVYYRQTFGGSPGDTLRR
ncbi:helix-turn-helix transcriptional regulator [Actinomycetospora chiangmaiensis]|uniref:helix-turn-helix transcriptional regulator n=1 Tax=Actinomycetospora chiangmaiensis TaxID=402650 RepID=UPI0012F8A00C|nr:helix-turn-helix transcriptional regulator [Actinomycetospora chiangmaiensis]